MIPGLNRTTTWKCGSRKEALAGVVERAVSEWRVPYFSCRGYTSQSEQWRAGKRLRHRLIEGKEVTIYHLGDHDPSGIDMTRDNQDRLVMFARSIGVRARADRAQ